jgi:hypothetical protein
MQKNEELEFLCRALNKLVWKLNAPVYELEHETETPETLANYIISELADADIEGIVWNNNNESFEVK